MIIDPCVSLLREKDGMVGAFRVLSRKLTSQSQAGGEASGCSSSIASKQPELARLSSSEQCRFCVLWLFPFPCFCLVLGGGFHSMLTNFLLHLQDARNGLRARCHRCGVGMSLTAPFGPLLLLGCQRMGKRWSLFNGKVVVHDSWPPSLCKKTNQNAVPVDLS